MSRRVPLDIYRRRFQGVHPPELNSTQLLSFDLGRFTFGLARRYTGDMYGRVGAHSAQYTLTLVKNP